MIANVDTEANKRCADLASPSYFNFALSIFILLGILISYLPQHHRIISRRSSEGISPYFVLLGMTSGTCAFANILNLPVSQRDLACCRELSAFDCTAGILGIAQVGVQWACFTVILLLFLLFFPHATPLFPVSKANTLPSYRLAILVFLTCILQFAVVFIVSLIVLFRAPSHLAAWANILGILGTCLAAVQFLPQIWTTWKLQHVGSLSIPMMCIQTPGSFVWVGSLAARLGWEGWSTWGIYLVTGFLQGCLLVMGITFELRARKRRQREEAVGETDSEGNVFATREDNERTRLLDNER